MPTPFPRMTSIRKLFAWSIALAVAGALSSSPVAPAAAAGPTQDVCGGELQAVSIGAGVVQCTHGGDPIPTQQQSAALAAKAALAGTIPAAPCAGNGKGGRRVRVLYGYPAGTNNHIKSQRAKVRDAVALADYNLDFATPSADGQHYRFYCKTDVAVTITAVKLVGIGGDGLFTFNDVMGSLANQVSLGLGPENFRDGRFVYSIFVDNIATVYPYGGQANLQQDENPDPATNANNDPFFNRYSMIRWGLSPASEAEIFQHETGHNLGAVQLGAPHSSGAYHCFDEQDIMCYNDGGPYFAGGGALTFDCAANADGLPPFDCLNDDYYNGEAVIDPGNYLFSHWNLVNSGWITWNAA
jgi:hypothetical protein